MPLAPSPPRPQVFTSGVVSFFPSLGQRYSKVGWFQEVVLVRARGRVHVCLHVCIRVCMCVWVHAYVRECR